MDKDDIIAIKAGTDMTSPSSFPSVIVGLVVVDETFTESVDEVSPILIKSCGDVDDIVVVVVVVVVLVVVVTMKMKLC